MVKSMKKLSLVFYIVICIPFVLSAETIAIVDAGSSGSRLYIYDVNQTDNGLKADLLDSAKVKPGIAMLSAEAMPEYLAQLQSQIQNLNQYQNVKLYWQSTAGMRLLSNTAQQNLYGAVNRYYSTDSHFQYMVPQSGTIPGRLEGAFLWIGHNYDQGTLFKGRTQGVIDIGGASTQIAFASKTVPHDVHFTMQGRDYYLVSKSYLGMGIDQLRNQFMDDRHCFLPGYKMPDGFDAIGNYELCQQDISPMIHQVHHMDIQVPEHMYFASYSSMQYTIQALNEHARYTSIARINHVFGRFCRTPWSEAQKHFTAAQMDYVPWYCFNGSYYAELLNNYGFRPHQKISLSGNASWTLGAALYYFSVEVPERH